jgi:5-methylcytosine-specific restriction endonuclease McrA
MSGKRKTRYRPEHMRMLNDKRWLETKRIVWTRAGALCEWCHRDGFIRSGVDCHHLIPFESAKTTAEAERLCYDPNNCVLLCIPCHQRAHKELGSKKKEAVAARRAERFERWKDKLSNLGRDDGDR